MRAHLVPYSIMADACNRNRSYAYEEFKLKREITNIFNTAREMLDAAEHILQVPLCLLLGWMMEFDT